uniref:Uncharacterized protein n=1 Tax=Candidatus Kentrum sp. DK TaxID=2126562 RepID=A0A450TNA6_9GAMM|nr:MAG: hypothetical protein BECKDK2373B_GA0170837_12384 [Candidatus Kentron sp. DK]
MTWSRVTGKSCTRGKHINNANTKEKIARIITDSHFKNPVLCSPEELACLKDDPIVEEICAYRLAHAAKYGNDIDRIFAAIKESEKRYGGRLVNRDHDFPEKRRRSLFPLVPTFQFGSAILRKKRKWKGF